MSCYYITIVYKLNVGKDIATGWNKLIGIPSL